ncbi:hypothetical protein FA13DRAFT_1736035 [Coprinellus micaceus]|uniref:Uncharacterized protein n=1 Tax=Coprinellus micaceus TaxID=71717 RepID=A0A4Y7T133_COPMI|nr:hypothetical protein FA13DRAFT_1736035 [Coprinellus micaceus]
MTIRHGVPERKASRYPTSSILTNAPHRGFCPEFWRTPSKPEADEQAGLDSQERRWRNLIVNADCR